MGHVTLPLLLEHLLDQVQGPEVLYSEQHEGKNDEHLLGSPDALVLEWVLRD